MEKFNRITLGIETSCDETGVAIYSKNDGMLSNVLYSQIELHERYGGVVPDLASRSHLEKIDIIIQAALDKAKIPLTDIDVIAVTHKPGLPGSLLVGVCFAKALAFALNKKLIGINHLEGHIFSACIENNIPFPFLCMTASGGHTALYIVHDFGTYDLLGETLDDAAGEAFDKIAKLLGLAYPGGPLIEKLAAQVEFQDFFSYPRADKKTLDFSFSGLKTAVLYDMVKRKAYDMASKKLLNDTVEFKQQVSSSLLTCISDVFKQKIELALKQNPRVKAVAFVGGVACNAYIKKNLKEMCEKKGVHFFVPSPKYCTDNGAMIAFVGNYKAEQGKFSDLDLDVLR